MVEGTHIMSNAWTADFPWVVTYSLLVTLLILVWAYVPA